MVIVGLDVGYSNLKVAAGEAGSIPQVIVRPSGAAPADRLGERITTSSSPLDGISVEVRGEHWVAAVEPTRLEGWQRPLHEDYVASPAYEALAKAGLVLADYRRVHQLVTGLPVSQAREPRRREALRRLLVGRHVTALGDVEVDHVRVVPQPIGAFVELVWSAPDADMLDRIETGTVLVLDAGYYSIDWAVIVAGELRRGASGTSLEAMSVLIDAAARRLADLHGGRPQPDAVEAALRQRREHVLVLGQRVPLAPVLERVATDAADSALAALRRSLRREAGNVDLVLLTGGGGALYGDGIRGLFPGAVVQLAPDPVTANARGFFHHVRR